MNHKITPSGYKKLLEEKETLEKERPSAVAELKRAREMGDLSENGFYKGTKAKLGRIDSRIRFLTRIIHSAHVIGTPAKGIVDIGAEVVIVGEKNLPAGRQEKTVFLVGSFEANPSENKVSNESPLGKALIGKKKDETIEVSTPSGEVVYKIKKIS